ADPRPHALGRGARALPAPRARHGARARDGPRLRPLGGGGVRRLDRGRARVVPPPRDGGAVVIFGDERLPERFWKKVSPERNSGCWLWTGCLDAYGYGRFSVDTRTKRCAHRIAFETLVAPIGAGLFLDHLCRIK